MAESGGKLYGAVNADCLDAMKRMPDNSIDAIVTDPPYGISFMSKGFDTFKKEGMTDNQAFQADMTPLFKEMLRIAKPGAHLLAFGGTRTYHRLTCAIEDAGWEVRDCLGWIYSCLSEDTEILTVNGWAKIGIIDIGDYAIAYDLKTRTFRTERVEDTHIYDYDDTAYHIVSDTTDQLVSRNHRVIVERNGVETLEFAENIAQEQEARVPILEDLQDMWNDIPMSYQGASNSERLLHNGLHKETFEPSLEVKTEAGESSKHDMCEMWKGVLSSECMEEETKRPLLFASLQWKGEMPSIDNAQSGTPGEVQEDSRANRASSGTVFGGEESSLEGGSDFHQQPWKLQGSEDGSLPKGVCINGSEERLCGRTSTCGCQSVGQTTSEHRSCASHQSQSNGQSSGELDVIQDKQRPQTIRGTWRTTTTLARIIPEHYKGRIWCITVPSGTIVARRNGKVFITGNSGMPKSMDISKAIDKKLGAQRAVRAAVGDHEGTIDFGMKNRCPKCGKPFFSANPCTCPREDLIPITDEAKKWSGWGTCLKPAFEPIVLARKPVEGTVVDNVLKWGCGGLNIDDCRVGSDKPVVIHSPKKETIYDSGHKDMGTWMENRGRFPANLIHDGSEEVLEVFPNDSARFFYCPKASKKEKGKDNIHPTVKPIELMKYLVKLVTPKGALVLDPFMGSGTTGVAALEIGRRFLGIEKEPEYFKIAENRLANANLNSD